MKLNITLALLVVSITGCGSKKESSEGITQFPLNKGETLSTHIKTLSLDSKTPEGVGTLLSLNDGLYNENNAGLCTWFLVSENRAMTNSHCIPKALKENEKLNCAEYLQGHIKTQYGSKIASCKKLLYFSDISETTVLQNDYALIELDKKISSTKIYELDRRGINEGERINILTMTHRQMSSGVHSEFIPHRCLIKSSDIWGRITSSGTSPLWSAVA